MTSDAGPGPLTVELVDRLQVAVGGAPDDALLDDLVALVPAFESVALEAVPGTPYSRQRLFASDAIEVMLANWVPGAQCAPHDHGGSHGFVAVLRGTFSERRFAWQGPDLAVTHEAERAAPGWIGFGPEVIHDMVAPEGGLTLHAYCPPPSRMNVFDLDHGEVLDLVGDFGAWIPPAGDHARTAFAEAAAAASTEPAPTDAAATGAPVCWVGHISGYGDGAAHAAHAARLAAERRTGDPALDVQVVALLTKADLVAELDRLRAEGRQLAELHVIGRASTYGPLLGTESWPEQLSPYEWRQLEIPFATDGEAAFHAAGTLTWFAPFFARTFGVPCSGTDGEGPDAAMREFQPAEPEGTTSYDRVADLYDAAYVDISVREAEWAWITEHASALRQQLGRPFRIVEIGCGNGALLRGLDDRGDVEAGVGFDDSEGMVERARRRSGDRERLRFDQIHGPHIDLPDDAVDVALSFLSFRYLDWDPLLEEIKRVLVPGGRFWVVDMVAQPVRASELPLLVRSAITHLRMPKRHPQFDKDLHALTSDPDWKTMLRYNPIRAEYEHKGFLESRFPGQRIEVLTTTRTQRVVAFDSGPVDRAPTGPPAP